MLNIGFKSYDIEIMEMILILKCINEHPKLKGTELVKLLGISKSTFYRKVEVFRSAGFQAKLKKHGYDVTFDQVVKQELNYKSQCQKQS